MPRSAVSERKRHPLPDGVGYGTVCELIPTGKDKGYRWNQFSAPHDSDEYIMYLCKSEGLPNYYGAENWFKWRSRKRVALEALTANYVDLDYYKSELLKGLSPQEIARQVLEQCTKEEIPEPTLIIFSGRGVYLKWLFKTVAPAMAEPRWKKVQEHLHQIFKEFGSDPQALDVSRVLRLVGSVNGKTSKVVRVMHDSERSYTFDELADAVLPLTREEYRKAQQDKWAKEREKRKRAREREAKKAFFGVVAESPKFSLNTLYAARLHDLITLAEMRGWAGTGACAGMRNNMLLLACTFASFRTPVRLLREEMEELAQRYASALPRAQVEGTLNEVERRAWMAARGEKITSSQEQHKGKEYDPRYTFKNSTIIDWLKITDDEQRQLKTLISKEIKQERNTEAHRQARREAGAVSRDVYEGKALERRQEALRLSSEGLNNSQIAKQMGVSRASVINYLKSESKG